MSNQTSMLEAMEAAAGFIQAEVTSEGRQLRVLARVQKEDQKAWLELARRLKLKERSTKGGPTAWSLDLSKMYFLMGDDEDALLVYGWRMILRSEDLEEACRQITTVVKTAKKQKVQITEMPLPGGARNRNSYGQGKGAAPTSGSAESTAALEYFRR